MSKKKTKIDLTKKVMKKIRKEKITMRPRVYFVAGSVLLGLGVAGAVVLAILFFNLFFFKLRMHSPFGYLLFGRPGIGPFLHIFPWLPFLLAVFGILGGSLLLKKYEISYKKSFWGLVISFLVMILVFSFLLSRSGLNRRAEKLLPLRPFYRQRFSDGDFVVGRVVQVEDGELIVEDPGGEDISVLIDENTRLPRGGGFEVGDMVRVVGEYEGPLTGSGQVVFEAKGVVKGGMPPQGPHFPEGVEERVKGRKRSF